MNFGLIGKRLSHSFSKDFFTQKFKKLNYKNHKYENYEIDNLNKLRDLIKKNQLSGLNVTIPFKQKIIKHLDEIESNARKINSVNTIKVENNKLILNGKGAFIGLPKVVNGSELSNPNDAPESIEYEITELNETSLILDINFKRHLNIFLLHFH